jgi:hypothetical protein
MHGSLMRRVAWTLILGLALEAPIVALVVLWSPARAAYYVGGRALVWDGHEYPVRYD